MTTPVIDALQYCNWSRAIFDQMRAGGVDAVHATVAYHETFDEVLANLSAWNVRFRDHGDLILRGLWGQDIARAQASGRTAIFLGMQTPGPLGDDLGRIELLHQLGIRFMQITYNNQSLLGAGYLEHEDSGLTRFGRHALDEMARVGLMADLSHAGPRTAREAIDAAPGAVSITHANPRWWHDVPRNVPDDVISALVARGGMLGFSLYPHHLAGGSDCSLDSFCRMVAEAAERYGVAHLGIGSDLCQNQPDSVVQWMREGRWSPPDSPGSVRFPPQPDWFKSNQDVSKIGEGLMSVGFASAEIQAILGGNWQRFFLDSFPSP